MRINHAHRRVKTRIRNTEHAYFAVIVRNIFDEPIDRIVGICAFVDILCSFLGVVWPHVDIFAFGPVAATNVLRYQNEKVVSESFE